MKHQKKRVKILILSLLSMSLLSNMPMWTTTVAAKKSHKQKHQHANQDDTDVVDDKSNSHSNSNDTNSNDNQHASSTDQNAENERRERKWKQYLGEQNEKKGKYFKELPQLVLKTLREEKVDIAFIGRLKSLGKPPFHMKKKETLEGSDVIVTKDHSMFSTQDIEDFGEAMSEFTVEKRAEAGTLFTQALVDAFNETKEKEGRLGKQGRELLFTPAFKEHKGRFDLDFLRAHLSDVKEMVRQAIAWFSDPTQRILLENYAEPMWKYVQKDESDSGHEDKVGPAIPEDNSEHHNGLEDGEEQEDNERGVDDDRSDKNNRDRNPEVDRLIREITHVYKLSENDAEEFLDRIKESLKIGWGNKVLKKLFDDGWKIEAIDRAIYGVEGDERRDYGNRDKFKQELDRPYVVFPRERKIYYRLGFENEKRLTASSNNVLRAIWEAFFRTYGDQILNEKNGQKDLEEEGIDFGEEGNKDRLNNIINDLAEKAIIYSASPDQLAKSLPNVFKIIDELVKKVVSPDPVAESHMDQLIASSVSRELSTNEDQLQGWQQQAIDRYRHWLAHVDLDILEKLASNGVEIYFVDGLLSDHPIYQSVAGLSLSYQKIQSIEALTFPFGISATIIERIFPPEYEDQSESRGVHGTSRITTLHEMGHAIERTLYNHSNKPSQRPELKRIMEDDLKKDVSRRTFKNNRHMYKNVEEYFGEAMGYYLATYPTVKGDKSYNQILEEKNPELYNYIKKIVEEIKALRH